jgi:hypothetical protein
MYTLNTDFQLGLITEEQLHSQLLAFWFLSVHLHLLKQH